MQIPITFTHAVTEYKGYLESVSGANTTLFHLTINNYHYGQFWLASSGEWRFDSNQHQWIEMFIDYFEKAVIAAMEDEP